jgi:hypothetical protein
MLSAVGRMQYGISMSSHTGLAGVISLMILGCATPVGTTETAEERAERKPPVIRHYDMIPEECRGRTLIDSVFELIPSLQTLNRNTQRPPALRASGSGLVLPVRMRMLGHRARFLHHCWTARSKLERWRHSELRCVDDVVNCIYEVVSYWTGRPRPPL